MTTRQTFDREGFNSGLRLLSSHVSNSQILADYRPLELIASGGFVSVMHLGNRPASEDFDYFLSQQQFGARYETVRSELTRIIQEVAEELEYNKKWANDQVRLFLTLLNNPQELFDRSKSQGLVLYRDNSIVVYAVLWEWVLVRKMKRLQMEGQPPRQQDWNDVVTISKLLYDRNNGPLDVQILRQFDDTEREPPVFEETIKSLRSIWSRFYQLEPFVSQTGQNLQQRDYWAWSGSQQRWAFIIEGAGPRPQNEWPVARGRRNVFCTDEATWREFDFDMNIWI